MPVFPKGFHFASDTNNFPDSCLDVILNIPIVLFPMRAMHEHTDVSADHLLDRISKHLCSGLIDQFHNPGFIDQNDRVRRGLNNGFKPKGGVGIGSLMLILRVQWAGFFNRKLI